MGEGEREAGKGGGGVLPVAGKGGGGVLPVLLGGPRTTSIS